MGRPFILYSEEPSDECDQSGSPSSCKYHSYDLWLEAARKLLEDADIPDSAEPAVTAILEYIFSKRCVAFWPYCEAVPAGGLGLLESKIGGVPYLLPTESWPSNNDTGLCHLWQLRVSELPASVQQALGYSRGLMQVFFSEPLDGEDGKWHLVRVLDDDQLVRRDRSEIELGRDAVLLEELRITSYTCAYDFPCGAEVLEQLPDGIDQHLAEVVLDTLQGDDDVYSTLQGYKLLGWPNWCRGPEWRESDRGERYMQLLQVECRAMPFSMDVNGTLLMQGHPTDRQLWDVSWTRC